MAYKLNSNANIRYSRAEDRLFSFLRNGKAITTMSITVAFYQGHRDPPYHARNSVVATLRGLERKIKINKEPFRLVKSKRNGPHLMSVRLEKI